MQEYLSYLLRLWRASEESDGLWRGSLQRPGAEDVLGFGSLEALIRFLREETGQIEAERPQARRTE